MRPRFAYPNVIPKRSEFIGCGRYAVFSSEENSPSGYVEITETPNTPNKSSLEHALQLIAPDSFDSSLSIFEKKDREGWIYQGDSLDLAYFLAHIHRSRKINVEARDDIWCTGVVQVNESQPILRKVDQIGFDIKLAHFLSDRCHDNLFVVPAANLTRENISKAEEAKATVLSLSLLKHQTGYDFNFKKSIIKVLPNELPDLIDFVFGAESRQKKRRFIWLAAALAACLFGILGWVFFSQKKMTPNTRNIMAFLEKGNFSEAMDLVARAPNSEVLYKQQKDLLETPIHLGVFVEYKLSQKESSGYQPIDSFAPAILTLSSRDYYRFRIEAPTATRDLHVYVFQMDQAGNVDILFPNPTLGGKNPVNADQWPLNLPPRLDQWLYLDKLPKKEPPIMKETLFFLASPWRANDIETSYAKVKNALDSDQKMVLIDEFQKKLRSRKAMNIPSVYCEEFSFSHSEF